jgi:hypothetical protein
MRIEKQINRDRLDNHSKNQALIFLIMSIVAVWLVDQNVLVSVAVAIIIVASASIRRLQLYEVL